MSGVKNEPFAVILSPDAEIIEIGDEEDGTDGSHGFKQPFTTFQPYTGKFGETFVSIWKF